MTTSRQELGALGEQVAVDHLLELGLRILQRNWRCRYGELDVIAAEGEDTVVFVEVKTRTGDGFGGLEYAVTPRKLRRIRRLAAIWLTGQETRWPRLRIDVIGVRAGVRAGLRAGVENASEVMHLRGVG